jgi:hypothetical protein
LVLDTFQYSASVYRKEKAPLRLDGKARASLDTWVIVGSLNDPFKVKISDLIPMKYKRIIKD